MLRFTPWIWHDLGSWKRSRCLVAARLGLLLVQLARLAGAGRMIAIDGVAERVALACELFAEAIEESNKGSIEALVACGASKISTLVFGYWPQVRPSFWSIALFRWDINIRESGMLTAARMSEGQLQRQNTCSLPLSLF